MNNSIEPNLNKNVLYKLLVETLEQDKKCSR